MRHRMRNRIICGIILSSTGLCLGASWTWDGSEGSDWADCNKWLPRSCSNLPSYPSTTNDDVDFSLDAIIAISTLTIDDMVMEYDVELAGNSEVLTVDSLLLDASGGGVTLTISGGATLVADGTN